MATGGDVPAYKRFGNTCGLCLEPYRGRQPAILPCFHTFCLTCLTTLAASATTATSSKADYCPKAEQRAGDCENQGGSEFEAEGVSGGAVEVCKVVILCPTCRHPVTVPEGGVVSLQTSVCLDHEDPSTTRKPPSCDMCEEGIKQDATHACETCRKRMCRTCRRFHDMFTDKGAHPVRPIEHQEQTTPSAPPATPSALATTSVKNNCHVHPDQSMCFHCKRCEVIICLFCKLTSHEGHITQDLQAAAKQARDELAGLLVKAKEQIQVLEASLDRLERDERELTRQEQERTQESDARHDALIAKATRARDEFLEGLRKKGAESQAGIRHEKAKAESVLKTLSGFVQQATCPSTLDEEVVTMKIDLQSALLSEDAIDEHNRRASRQEHLTFFPCNVDACAVETDRVRAYMGQLQAPNKTPAVSLRALASMVNSWDSDFKSLIQKGVRPVSFFASLTSARSSTVNNAILIFENIQCNEGGGYNVKTGVFTAPQGGLYVFLLTVKAAANLSTECDAVIKVNSKVKIHVQSADGASECCRATVRLEAGGTVRAVARDGYYAEDETTFCGALF